MSSPTRNVSYDGYPLPQDPPAGKNDNPSTNIDDFVSFPTLPDPEVVANRSLSTIISKTLRKVTNNASNLVHNYTSPTDPRPHDILDSSSICSQGNVSILPPNFPENAASATDANIAETASSQPSSGQLKSPPKNIKRVQGESAIPLSSPAATLSLVATAPPVITTITPGSDLPKRNMAETPPGISNTPASENAPRVTSDNLFLKLSTSSVSKLPIASLSTSDVTAAVNTDTATSSRSLANSSSRFSVTHSQQLPKTRTDSTLKSSTVKTLQNRISSIFNNLPNDIEVSDDDSASDQDTEDHDTSSNSFTNDAGGMSFLSQSRPEKPPPMSIRVSEASVRKPKHPKSPSRRMSSHFPSAIFDGARSIIQTNLGVGSSASSMISSNGKKTKKRKQRPHRLSNNPLKNGGIPKKYWMNDSFVSDCLNCFKQFTAFRRKHHCRFCGQIFCADCTIFISYSQYKQQRHGKVNGKVTKAFKDKLRVCKPCYSDVVVYLSDDSSSSSEEEKGDASSEVRSSANISNLTVENSGTAGVTDNVLTRLRSYSASSTRSGAIVDSPLSKTKRTPVFNSRESPSLKTASSPFSENQRSPEGISHRHPPKMAIPTRRTGEAVEIAIPSGSYTQSSSLNAHQTLRSSGHGSSSKNVVGSEVPDTTTWYMNYPRRSASVSSEIGNLKSLDNISSFYKSVVNGKYTRLPAKSKLEFSKRAHDILSQAQDQDAEEVEPEDDVESENEDEKVMSLYTSLNHPATVSSMPTRPLNHLSSSVPGVPTLLEFPGIEGKYGPANMSQSDAMKRFEFKPIDSFNNSTMSENKQRSNFRSNERAKASLRRIKDRRNQRSVRKIHSGISMMPSFEATYHGHVSESEPVGSSALFTPKSDKVFGPSEEGSSKVTPNHSLSPQKELKSNISSMSIRSDDKRNFTRSPQESFNDQVDLTNDLEPLSVLTTREVLENSTAPSLNTMFDMKLKHMIKQCLEDCDIKGEGDQGRWVEVLSKTFASIDRVKVNDTLDVKQYIKIKKILGGRPEDTSVLDGLFITKDIDSKRMPSSINNPKVALLVFPLEYLKQKEQFISLRVVNSQQSVYISNLVSRLISFEPDLVVVGDTVCGLAQKLLEEANITVISNVKPQVIERISRYTKADIFQSVNDLFFKKGALGTCRLFEVKKFVFEDIVKTFTFFVGSELESGFTICLRGGDEEYLSSVKYASESLIPGAFNARFERSFFHDFSLAIDTTSSEISKELKSLERLMEIKSDDPNDLKSVCVNSMEHYGVFNYVKLFSERILSFSPAVCYPLPVTLSNVVNSFESFVYFYDLDKTIQQTTENDEIKPQWLEQLQFDFNLERFNGKSDIVTFLKFVSSEWVQFYQREFNFRLRTWSNSMKYSIYQLYPIFHRSIHFLHSRVSIKHATPCYGPVVVVVDFYSDNDKCIGTFLDQTLQETGKACDECGDLLLNHYKTYVHDNYKIDLIVERIDNVQVSEQFRDKEKRIMWSYCTECNTSSPIAVMSDETYYLSLGKFFELNFWSNHAWNEKLCEHDFFKSQVKYFGINGYFIRMEISEIINYEVVVPRKKLEFVATVNLESKLDSLKIIQESSTKFFQSISNRLNRIKVDTFEKAEAGHTKIEELKARVANEEAFIASKTLKIYESTIPSNYMSLNVVQRDIQELGVSWDKEFNDFERRFLPTENEITKITQFHLRNFLMDRLDTEMKDGDDISEDPDVKSPEKPDINALLVGESVDQSPIDHHSLEHKPANDNLLSTGSRRIPSTVIEDKIMQIRQSLEDDNNKILRSPTKSKADPEDFISAESSPNEAPKRVQDLTNYFNQMTLEFQKQREAVLERQSSKYKAVPIVNSQPIVEIYDNIEDVVDVDRRLTAISKPSSTHEKTHDSDGSKTSDLRGTDETIPETPRKVSATSVDPAKEGARPKIDIPQPEKNSLLKSLSNFWADRSATLWDPLEYPLDFTEHTFADSEVIVREDEPSSLVAFCLSTSDYKQKIAGMGSNESVISEDKGSETMEANEQFKKKSEHFAKLERKFKKRNDHSKSENSELEAIMTKTKSSHLKYQFVDGSTEMSCKIFYSEQFDALRKACGNDDSFIQSLSRCVKWNSTGGKSGSNFLKTLDNRYIVKELSKSELESFVSIAPFYFKYISQSTFNTLTTALAKIFGFYQVEFKNSMNGKTFKMDFLIMENLFYNRKTTRIFDLKGSMRNRHVKQTGKENEVLLDENMIEYIYESPVFVREQSKKLLRGSLFNDTSFLSAMDVMDYSLVIGIDDSSGKLYVGIIDWLRTFTWDKKVENWVKGKSLVGKKGKDPTIVTPKQYRTRFREAMDRYILEVPDIWYEGST